MRALRVVGLDDDGKTVICEDPARGERFSIPVDERLRAAARGDATHLGQVQVEMESQMRPKEIQARIRAGASVEQVSEAAGIPSHRVERFAYPVLLERSRTADLAQRAHPMREDGPDVQTLGEVVSHAFSLRGQEYSETEWDSWRGEDGKWVISLRWYAGRSDNRAHWVFHRGAHGGTVIALDEHAADLLDPSPSRPLRTVRPVTQLARQALDNPYEDTTIIPAITDEEPVDEEHAASAEPTGAGDREAHRPGDAVELGMDAPARETLVPPPLTAGPRPGDRRAAARAAADAMEGAAASSADGDHDGKAGARRKKNHPMVPSWEDVLLGVRSQRG
ncbi:septation protein SepH [Actinoalloteichus hymeniacidonis]|uniref:DUF3071 family protein n=1 Tax=Actinoalloteichus hymeniacidonis TaxID=340345 RepID=A0AAC9N158_9PSEU|nr:septation protein SepH [Actinoalloteichus hymeniacidonis]AOS65807.1 putative DUF3071 family protein [Actinoalloteichus hymeniacidonis]MBB5906102.1 hypothetical protein [Actinoalloteichus hymeniacidonis]